MKIKTNKYLIKIFEILKKRDEMILTKESTHFTKKELRLLTEIIYEQNYGRRLISAQLAKRLGLTRSAVSQMVNRLEKQGIVRRVADDVDKKIAYIQINEEVLDAYSEDLEECYRFVDEIVQQFGEDKFNTMHQLFTSFIDFAKLKWNKESSIK